MEEAEEALAIPVTEAMAERDAVAAEAEVVVRESLPEAMAAAEASDTSV